MVGGVLLFVPLCFGNVAIGAVPLVYFEALVVVVTFLNLICIFLMASCNICMSSSNVLVRVDDCNL